MTEDAGDALGAPDAGDPLFPGAGNGGFDVLRYDVALRVDPGAQAIDVDATLTAIATHRLARFNLDFEPPGPPEVTVMGASADVVSDAGELVVTPPVPVDAGTTFRVRVRSSGRPSAFVWAGGRGGWRWLRDGAVGTGFPGLHTWLPTSAFDPAWMRLDVTVPAGLAAIAAGRAGSVTHGEGWTTYGWATGLTADVGVVVGRYEELDLGTVGGVSIRGLVPPELGPQARAALDVVPAIVAFYHDRFGSLPFAELRLAWVDEGAGDPFEGLVLWGEAVQGDVELAHVLAHEWFTVNAVPRSGRDAWLRSAFANYGDVLWTERSRGVGPRDDLIRRWHRRLGATTEPPAAPSRVVGNDALFARGALGLHALRALVGDEAFFEVLRRWVASRSRSLVELEEFRAVAEEVTGRDLGSWWSAWLLEPAVPGVGTLGLDSAP